jgi:hypothetical protein
MSPPTTRPGPRAANEIVGLLLLLFLAVLVGTGAVIWGLRASDRMSGVTLVFVHAWAGIISLPILAAKLVVGVRVWRHKTGPVGMRPGAHLLTAALAASVAVLYGSGLMMYANTTPGGAEVYKQVHLWSAVAGAGLTTWHLARYLRRALRLLNVAAGRAEVEDVDDSRRLVLRSFGVGLLGLLALRGSGQVLADAGSADPNDFPVTITSGGEDRPDPASWTMSVEGDVAHAMTLGLADLEGRSIERHTYPLDCVIGWSATREWGGVPLASLLDEVEPLGEILSLRVRSTTGYEVTLSPEEARRDGSLIAWEVEGVPLTPEHGYPGRLMVPDVIGEKCVKWLDRITVVAAGGSR